MTDAVVVTDEVVVVDNAAEIAAQAEFESGYLGEPTESALPVTPEEIEKKTAEDAAAKKAADDKAAAEKAAIPEYRQITVAEYNELKAMSTQIDTIRADHRKELDKAFGKVGGIERTLTALQAATPTGYTVDVTDDVVAELAEVFPELGKMTLEALKKFASKLKGTAPPAAVAAEVDPKQVRTTVETQIVAIQTEVLEDEHPDWRTIVGDKDSNNDYRKWLAKQPAEYQQKLVSTNSAAVIGKSIVKFKAEAAEVAKAAAVKVAADKAVPSTRKQRLEAAATPRGAGGHTTDDTEDPFEEGFKTG